MQLPQALLLALGTFSCVSANRRIPEHQWKFSTKRCGEAIRSLMTDNQHEVPFINGLLGSYITGRLEGTNGALFRSGVCAPISCLQTPKLDSDNRPIGESPKQILLKSLPHTPSDSTAVGSCISIANYVDAGGQFSPESLGVSLLDPGNAGAGFALEYRDGSRCQATGSGTTQYRKTIIEVHCDKSAALPRLIRVREGGNKGICTYRAQIGAFAACATPQGQPAPTPPPIQTEPPQGQRISTPGSSARTPGATPHQRRMQASSSSQVREGRPAAPPAGTQRSSVPGTEGGPVVLQGLSGCDVPLHDGQVRAVNDPRGPLGDRGRGGRDAQGRQMGGQGTSGGSGGRQGGTKNPADGIVGYVSDLRRCPTGGGAKIRLHGEFPVGVRLVQVRVGGNTAKDCERTFAGTYTCTAPPGFGEGHELRADFVDERVIVTGQEHRQQQQQQRQRGGTGSGSTGSAPGTAAPATPQRQRGNRILNLRLPGAVSYELRFNPFDFDARSELGVGGLDAEIRQIFRRLFASRAIPRETLRAMGASHVKGALLHGPPGVGKTLLARRLADYLQSSSVRFVAGPEILSKFVGASEGNVRALFAPAEEEWRKKGEASGLHVIIIDEMDALCTKRSGAGEENTPAQHLYDGVVDQILAKMDGLSEQDNVLVLGLTNRKDVLDPALLRPGRFEVHVRIGYPDEAGRRDILEVHTEKMKEQGVLAPDVDLAAIASASDGCSGADMAGIVRDASGRAMERSFRAVVRAAERASGGAVGSTGSGGGIEGLQVTRSDFEEAVQASMSECAQHEKEAQADGEGENPDMLSPADLQKRLQPGGMLAAKPLRTALTEASRFVASAWGIIPAEPVPDYSSGRHTHTMSGGGSRRMTLAPVHISGQPPRPRGFAGASLLLYGPRAAGKTAMAAELARYFSTPGMSATERARLASTPTPRSPGGVPGPSSGQVDAPLVRVVTPEQLLDISQQQRSRALLDIVTAAKERTNPDPASSRPGRTGSGGASAASLRASIIVLEDIERLLELVSTGGGAVQAAHQTLHVMSTLLAAVNAPTRAAQKALYASGRSGRQWAGRFLLIATTSRPELLDGVGLTGLFSKTLQVPLLGPWSSARSLRDLGVLVTSEIPTEGGGGRGQMGRPRAGSRNDQDEVDRIADLLGSGWSCAVGDIKRIAEHIHWLARHSGPQEQRVRLDRSTSLAFASSAVLEESLSLLGLQSAQSTGGLRAVAQYEVDAGGGKALKS